MTARLNGVYVFRSLLCTSKQSTTILISFECSSRSYSIPNTPLKVLVQANFDETTARESTFKIGKKHLPAQLVIDTALGALTRNATSHTKEEIRHTNLHELKK